MEKGFEGGNRPGKAAPEEIDDAYLGGQGVEESVDDTGIAIGMADLGDNVGIATGMVDVDAKLEEVAVDQDIAR